MFHVYRYNTDEEARKSGTGAHGGEIVIVDSDFHPVPTERVYLSCEKSLAESRCEELNHEEEMKGIPDIFDDLFGHDHGGEGGH